METFYGEISGVLDSMEQRSKYFGGELSDTNELQSHIMELKDQLLKEKDDYNVSKCLVIRSFPWKVSVSSLDL
jgi:1-phosphatidylinositol-3-phosphate 5-kinase